MKSTEQAVGQFASVAISDLLNINETSPAASGESYQQLERVAIVSPSGNTTAVVFDQVSDTDRAVLNNRVMQGWKTARPDLPEVEQCCTVTTPQDPTATGRVEMFGGEFCGNAARSAIWLLTGGKNYIGLIEVSGVDSPLTFKVRNGAVRLEMPVPSTGELVRPVKEGRLVQLGGIMQLVVTEPQDSLSPRQLLTSLLQENTYNLNNQPAVGVTYYDETSGRAEFSVWVKEVNTVFDETACGSGTSAIGIAQLWPNYSSVSIDVIQPSGEIINTEAIYRAGTRMESYITGTADVLYDGALKLP